MTTRRWQVNDELCNELWMMTEDNFRWYESTKVWQAPFNGYATESEYRRDSAEFAADYINPARSGMNIYLDLQVDVDAVDIYGNNLGRVLPVPTESSGGIGEGNAGRIILQPPGMTITEDHYVALSGGGHFAGH